jgi:hypothetical protein
MKVPDRKRLPHDVPLWVDPSKACYFITICCAPRGINQLAHDQMALDLIETIKYRNAKGIWYVRLALVMPDHVHLVVWFPEIETRSDDRKQMEGVDRQNFEGRMAARFFRTPLTKGREFSRESRLYLGEPGSCRPCRKSGRLAVRVHRRALVGSARCAVRTPQRGVPTLSRFPILQRAAARRRLFEAPR